MKNVKENNLLNRFIRLLRFSFINSSVVTSVLKIVPVYVIATCLLTFLINQSLPEISNNELRNFSNSSTLQSIRINESVLSSSFISICFTKNLTRSSERLIQKDTLPKFETERTINSLKKDKLKGGRLARWYYGWVVFKEYSWFKRIFGGGFDYLEMYGKEFGEAEYDWPHNPMISAFLYSGLIGGFAFIWFMFMVVVNYIRYLKKHLFFFVSFIVTFFFVFFSDTSLFNTPLFTFLSIIPFFTRYLALREELGPGNRVPFKKIIL